MVWVVLCAVIAAVGAGALVAYGALLLGKGKDVLAEAKIVAQRAGQVRALTRDVQLPHSWRE